MHIHQYADMVSFDEVGIGGTFPATETYRELIKKLHPAQFLTGRIKTPLYEITYSYVTARGNVRRAKKYILLQLEHEEYEFEIELQLDEWVRGQNERRPWRRISNVRILEIKKLAYATLQFEY